MAILQKSAPPISDSIEPLKAEKFLEAVSKYMEPYKGKYNYHAIFQDHLQKTDHVDAGYGQWLQKLLEHLVKSYNLNKQARILDIGCGTGELVVRMDTLGFEATGMDLHEKHLELARILAKENNLSDTIFVLNKNKRLPFDDNSFDIVTMFSVLEHLDKLTLKWLLPELARICNGVIYVLVPNKLKPTDDHTGLHFVSYLPRWLAIPYIKLRGKYQYFISESGTWDVYHRNYTKVVSVFKRYGYKVDLPPDDVIYPPLEVCPSICRIGKDFRIGNHRFFVGLPLPCKIMRRLGYPKQAFYPYLNLIFCQEK